MDRAKRTMKTARNLFLAVCLLLLPTTPTQSGIMEVSSPAELAVLIEIAASAVKQIQEVQKTVQGLKGLKEQVENFRLEDVANQLQRQVQYKFNAPSRYDDRIKLRGFNNDIQALSDKLNRDLITIDWQAHQSDENIIRLNSELEQRFRNYSEQFRGVAAAERQIHLARNLAVQSKDKRQAVNEIVTQLQERVKENEEARNELNEATADYKEMDELLRHLADFANIQVKELSNISSLMAQNTMMLNTLVELREQELEIQAAVAEWERDEELVARSRNVSQPPLTTFLTEAPEANTNTSTENNSQGE